MNNEQKIIDKIIADAETEKKKILDAAQVEVDAILEKAEELAEKERLGANVDNRTEAEKTSSKVISGAVREGKNRVLKAKQDCLHQVMEQAKSKLLSLQGKEYEQVILGMLAKAEQGDEIIFSAEDKGKLEQAVAEKGFCVSQQTREMSGGFIVKKGDIEYNYSFESIIAVEKEALEQIAAEILFA